MRTSALAPAKTARASRVGQRVKRSSLQMYDLYSLVGKKGVYMHTGARTRPPSGGRDKLKIVSEDSGKTLANVVVDHFVTLSRQGGKDIIGWQSVKVMGTIKTGEDGTNVTYKDKMVTFKGKADVTLPDTIS